jgi:AcrR family transcriptional regulator
MPASSRVKRGRPATASPDDVVRLVREQFTAGQRVDITVVARTLGLGRATIYRWFGSREGLLGEALAQEFEALVGAVVARTPGYGAGWLLEVFDGVNRALASSEPLRRLLDQERDTALRILTSSGGTAQPRAVAAIQALIDAQVRDGHYQPPASPETLAYAVVRLAEAFLYNDAAAGIRGDHERLRDVEAALLGVRR